MVWLSAHLAAILVGSLIIMMGSDVLIYGWTDGLGFSKWVGGFLIFVILGFLTSPIGIGLRFLLGRIGQRNLPAAIATGVIVGLALIPLLHPAMYSALSIDTNPIGLLLVHTLAGCAGGLAWFGVELFQIRRRERRAA